LNCKTCAITGHRPTRFKWKYNENNTGCKRLKRRLRDQFILLYEQGVHHFWVGGALGVDLWAGEILLQLKQAPEFDKLKLYLALPFLEYNDSWDIKSKNRIAALRDGCASVVIVGTVDKPTDSYRKRNVYMVNQADILLAVFDNEHAIRSGTGMTVNYAKKKGIPITLIHPDTGIVSSLPEKAIYIDEASLHAHRQKGK